MPPLPDVPGVIRCDLHWTIGTDDTALSRLFFKYTGGPPSASDLNSIATQFREAWVANLQGAQSDGQGLLETILTDLSSDTAARGEDTTEEVGTRSGGILSAGTATLINLSISRRYRGGKPRLYLPLGVTTDLNNPSAWTTGFVTAVTSGYRAFITACSAASSGSTDVGAQANVSYYQGFHAVESPTTGRWRNVPTLRAAPVVDTIVESICNPKPASQRRRNAHSS